MIEKRVFQERHSVEAHREQVLDNLGFLDPGFLQEFQLLVSLAAKLLRTEASLFSVISQDTHFVKAISGGSIFELPRRHSFCSTVVESERPLVVQDMRDHPIYARNPFVTGEPHVRFYAGIPVRAKIAVDQEDAVAIGSLCVIDPQPRQIDADDLKSLAEIASLVEALVNARALARHAELLAVERQRTIELLNREHRQFKQAERMANIGSWRLTLDDMKSEWSEQVYQIHELPVGDQPKLDQALAFYPAEEQRRVTEALDCTIRTGRPYDLETDFITAKGQLRRVRAIGETEISNGKTVAVCGVIQDVTDRYRMEQTLRRIADTDDLTKLPNRAHFNRSLQDNFAEARSSGSSLVLLLIDLDGFKRVNDTCGHGVGDEVLRRTATTLRASYLKDAFAARLGGDEFVLLVTSQADCVKLDDIVARLLNDLKQVSNAPSGPVEVSGTIGIARLDETVVSPSELLLRADNALYASKRRQRGTATNYRSG